jgi:hypothetical protein
MFRIKGETAPHTALCIVAAIIEISSIVVCVELSDQRNKASKNDKKAPTKMHQQEGIGKKASAKMHWQYNESSRKFFESTHISPLV